ncbi:relaxation protein [Janthinobacterium sp. 17J80-10]|nr:relaxation protein [Janthinobacterium sp. 17J80-10]
MATYHCSMKIGGKGKAAAHANYIARAGRYSHRQKQDDLEALWHGNMPKWAEHDPGQFWKAADAYERANANTYRELEVALPRELTPAQRIGLVQEFIRETLGSQHAYSVAIHNPRAAIDGGEQPHAHIQFSERIEDGIPRDPEIYFRRAAASRPDKNGNRKPIDPAKGGARKDQSWGTTEKLELIRELWADLQNQHLSRYGHQARVDHRSLAAQHNDTIDQGNGNNFGAPNRLPEKHLGWKYARNPRYSNPLRELRKANNELRQENLAALTATKLLDRELASAKCKTYGLKEQPIDQKPRQYIGQIIDSTEHYVLQRIGSNVVVIHDRQHFPDRITEGVHAVIDYAGGISNVLPNDRPKHGHIHIKMSMSR